MSYIHFGPNFFYFISKINCDLVELFTILLECVVAMETVTLCIIRLKLFKKFFFIYFVRQSGKQVKIL